MIDAGEISSYGFELEEVSREQSWEVRGRALGWLWARGGERNGSLQIRGLLGFEFDRRERHATRGVRVRRTELTHRLGDVEVGALDHKGLRLFGVSCGPRHPFTDGDLGDLVAEGKQITDVHDLDIVIASHGGPVAPTNESVGGLFEVRPVRLNVKPSPQRGEHQVVDGHWGRLSGLDDQAARAGGVTDDAGSVDFGEGFCVGPACGGKGVDIGLGISGHDSSHSPT
ncbi:MAG: hypothetical protein WCH91_07350 [bacterium]